MESPSIVRCPTGHSQPSRRIDAIISPESTQACCKIPRHAQQTKSAARVAPFVAISAVVLSGGGAPALAAAGATEASAVPPGWTAVALRDTSSRGLSPNASTASTVTSADLPFSFTSRSTPSWPMASARLFASAAGSVAATVTSFAPENREGSCVVTNARIVLSILAADAADAPGRARTTAALLSGPPCRPPTCSSSSCSTTSGGCW